MEIQKREDITYQKPIRKNELDYPYSYSAKIFHTKQLFLYSEKIEPGKCSSAPHFHKAIDEIAVVTKGELIAIEGEVEVNLKCGDSICFFANSGKKHFLENRSSDDAEFLLFRKAITQDDVIY